MNNFAYEINFDGIVGPTHNYSGLSYGNIASQSHQYNLSNPREAALQGLKKMKLLADLGIKQAVLPPHETPHLSILRKLGYRGSDKEIIEEVFKNAPNFLYAASSAAAMWTANMATVCPSCDAKDGRVHLTPANMATTFHRMFEHFDNQKFLKVIFKNSKHFVHHQALPASPFFADEGAANHTRFCKEYGGAGVHLFIFGRQAFHANALTPKIYPARQTCEASQAVARLHGLSGGDVIFWQQHPDAIDAGAFHNDVVAVGNKNLFMFHEKAFVDKSKLISEIAKKVSTTCTTEVSFLEVTSHDVDLDTAIKTYLFNSQIISPDDGKGMILIAPIECQENEKTRVFLENMSKEKTTPIDKIHYQDLRQSMRNGGGPACLRLRVVLTSKELAKVHPEVFLDDVLYKKLTAWVKKHYRDKLHPTDLADPNLLLETRSALDDLTKILNLGTLYDFQQ